MLQQSSAEPAAAQGVVDAFLAEVQLAEGQPPGQPPRRKRRTTGRVARPRSRYNAPPAHVRPCQPATPVPFPIQDGDAQGQPQQHFDDSSIRASQVAELDPIHNITEAEGRWRWLTVSPDLRKIFRDLHVQFGHPTKTARQRILRRQGATVEAIHAADLLTCDSCGIASSVGDQSL